MSNCMESRMSTFEVVFHKLLRYRRARLMSLIDNVELFPGQMPILAIIDGNNGCTQKEIGEKMKFKPASITDSLKRMEKAGLISREQDNKDLRITRVYITDMGKEQMEKAFEISHSFDAICFAGFSKEEKETFINLMKKMNKNLNQEGDD